MLPYWEDHKLIFEAALEGERRGYVKVVRLRLCGFQLW